MRLLENIPVMFLAVHRNNCLRLSHPPSTKEMEHHILASMALLIMCQLLSAIRNPFDLLLSLKDLHPHGPRVRA